MTEIYHIVGTNIANSSVGEYYHGYDRKRNGEKDPSRSHAQRGNENIERGYEFILHNPNVAN